MTNLSTYQPTLVSSEKLISDIVHHMKYSNYVPDELRRETFEESIFRNKNMHIGRYSDLEVLINEAYQSVYDKSVLPSMRSMQFAGKAILRNHARMFNCAFLPIDNLTAFRELLFLLLSGAGVGFSVQRHHVAQLPAIQAPKGDMRYLIGDSIEGWADAVSALIKAYFQGKPRPRFDYSDIRPKGSLLKTSGGRAPGHHKFEQVLNKVETILLSKRPGTQLHPIECHDILCHLADAVISGGIRRSALISLFSYDDEDMLNCKTGEWWKENVQRARSNNSAVAHRDYFDESDFWNLWERISTSPSGDPGIVWTSNLECGFNPCVEAALNPNTFCNLVEINAANINTQFELNHRSRMAARIATIQSSYTDFHYLRQVWKNNTERDSLIGVSMTGIVGGNVLNLDMREAALIVREENARMAKLLGIRKAARTTMVKPAGTTSLLLGGVSNGIHAYHNDYYFKRITVSNEEPIYKYLKENLPEILEPSKEKGKEDSESFIVMPMKAPEGAITRDEGSISQLERIRKVYREWIIPGHRRGVNTNNISATISVKSHEWDEVGTWLLHNKMDYQAVSVLPYFGGDHPQLPLEDIDKQQYDVQLSKLKDLDLSKIVEAVDSTDLQGEGACVGGACAL